MKKTFYLLLLLVITGACTNKTSMTIKGTISNAKVGDQVVLTIPYLDLVDTLCTIKEEGTFNAIVSLEKPHLGSLLIGEMGFNIYCKPGESLQIDLDWEKIKRKELSGVAFSGKYSESAQLIFNIKKTLGNVPIGTLLKMEHKEFKKTIEDQLNEIESFIVSYQKKFPKDSYLISELRLSNEVNKATVCKNYALYHKQFNPEDTLDIPEEIKNDGKSIPLTKSESFKENNDYKRFVISSTISNIAKSLQAKSIKADSKEYINGMFEEIKNCDTFQEVKDEMTNGLLSSYSYYPQESKEIIKDRYKETLQNDDYIKEFESTLVILSKLETGNPSPTFNYADIKGNKTSLSDLKGKYVYIDVWATWCGPCKGEIPHLKKLEKEFHGKNIEFVSISVDTDRKEWIKMVIERDLQGIQLCADKAWDSDFIKNYAIRGIPHFILLDKKGRIIDSNASRPSNPETKARLTSLLD